MDLQLGLALPRFPDKGFDLNSSEIEEFKNPDCNPKKRNFLEAFEEKSADHHLPPQTTLALLVWDDQQSNQGDNFDEIENIHVVNSNSDNGVVGWPPINSWRKKTCQRNSRGCVVNCVTVENGGGYDGGGGGGRGRNSTYVKVKMEGVGIARKVDLSLYHSYQTLLQSLVGMFGKCQQSVQSYQLTFQDKEGDWLLAEDVDWGSFIRSVQRLKLLRRRE
ncbi:hypothetical protein ACH5RR_004349 [Cinchona calisaya]|uniref:Auxin-responsive protein n=1 Tax=Cinchona calisaya TaxID=153742 RepID=A0ABD3AXP9_9GENT